MTRRKGWRGPEYEGELPSLGWAVLEWTADWLPSPRDHDDRLILTDEQARLIVAWYTIEPTSGRFLYRRGASRRAKGWGKSPLAAVLGIGELCGDVRFAGWDQFGEPVGRPWGTMGDPQAWVQIAACSDDQTDNTHSVIYDLLTANDEKAAEALGLDVGITRTYLKDGKRRGKLEPVTASAGTREGQPITFGLLDETHLWTARSGGLRLARTIRRNAAKIDGRTFETTNAFEPGEDSVAERTHKAVTERGAAGVFYDAVEAPEIDLDEASDAEIKSALKVAFGDAWWVDLDRLVAEARDPDVPREDVERFSFNWNRKGGTKAVDPRRWDELAVARPIPDGTYIGLGFDGSISHDATAIVACTQDLHVFVPTIGPPSPQTGEYGSIWLRPIDAGRDWRIPRLRVEEVLGILMGRYKVGRMFMDPPRWQTEGERWAELYGDEVVLFFDTNQPKRMSVACGRYETLLGKAGDDHRMSHDGNTLLRSHVLAMIRRKAYVKPEPEDDGRTRYLFDKGQDGRKIDAGIASVLAVEAASTMPEPKSTPTPDIF